MENDVKIKADILLLAKEIDDLKGSDTLALDLSKECSWTGFFVITTCSSNTHLRGVVDEIRKYLHNLGYNIKQNRKNPGNQGWVLLDCGDFVIHLMDRQSRDFYNLEDRWSNAETFYSSSKLS
ncbi:MAG: ribosome silencing factor [Spirochaetaceae bacterium 4572_7]|nr:MAG: ribosome silencing factor [Spirochaetaceae bacterium 4572_7]